MAKPTLRGINFPMSLQHYTRFGDPSDQIRGTFQIPNMVGDYLWFVDDFTASTMVAAYWSTAVTAGGAPTAFAYNAQRGGAVRGAAGTSANGVSTIYGNTIHDAADKCAMLIRFKAPAAVTSFHMMFGFINAPTDEKLVIASAIDATGLATAANGLTDGSFFVIDTGATLTTMALNGIGTSTAIAGTTYGTYTPTASKWITALVIATVAGTYGRIWDSAVSGNSFGTDQGGKFVASGPDTGVALQPIFMIKTLNTTTKTIDIDYIAIGTERNAV